MNENYSQPDFYHFNEDSTKLANWIGQRGLTAKSILDLGAGSGIIGIELGRLLKPNVLTLVELQQEYHSHIEANCLSFLPRSVAFTILIQSFSEFRPDLKYDLIVCNPPYYLPGKGELPQNLQRAQARTFLVDSWPILLNKIQASLADDGKAFIVLKRDQRMFEWISKEGLRAGLAICKNDSEALMFLELFRLNEN